VLVLHAGGLGDLVLSSSALFALRAARPRARITLVARATVAPFVAASPLRTAVDRVIPLALDPYRWAAPNPTLFGVLKRALAGFDSERVATFVSAELRPTWFTFILAAHVRPERAITLRRVRFSRSLVDAVCEHFDLTVPGFERYADANTRVHELERYRRLARYLEAGDAVVPRWSVAPARAQRFLRARGLERYSYAVCFPGGAAGTPFKRWPAERFVAVLSSVRSSLGGRVLIAGAESERGELTSFARQCAQAGLEPHVFAGELGTFAELQALLANAWGYLGNDTGLAHVAAAYGVPGVTVYGGGTWPMYAPWAPGSIGVVHPLPCFGCFWDCAFGHGICSEQVTVEGARAALEAAVAAPAAPARTIELARLSPETLGVIKDAAGVYREAQADRAARLEALLSLARRLPRSP